MKKMKRFLVTLLSSLTAIACIAGITACNNKKDAATESSASNQPSYDINVNLGGNEEHKHEWFMTLEGKDATCTEEGKTAKYICMGCNASYGGETIDALGHDMTVEVAEVLPTCGKAGKPAYKQCSRCDATVTPELSEEELAKYEATGAHSLKWVQKVNPTCTEDGNENGYICTGCTLTGTTVTMNGEDLPVAAVIPALGHDYGDQVVSCVNVRECEVCGHKDDQLNAHEFAEEEEGLTFAQYEALAESDDEEAKALFAEIKAALAAAGLDISKANDEMTITIKAQVCTECDYAINYVAEHECGKDSNVVGVATLPTCATKGLTVAGKTVVAADIDDEDFVEATMIKAGTNICACEVCGLGAVKAEVAVADHKADAEVELDCGEKATCIWCERTFGKAKAHNYVTVKAKAATCLEDGHSDGKYCKDCNESTVSVYVALGHNFAEVEAKEAVCVNAGNAAYSKCKKCALISVDGDVNQVESDDIPVIEGAEWHTFAADNETAKDATCTTAGSKGYGKCTVCNASVTSSAAKIPALGHDDSWVTCTEGSTCTRCDVELKASGHKMTTVNAVGATCLAEGNIKYYNCEKCGKNFSDSKGTTEVEDVVVPTTGHQFIIKEAVEATCTTDGENGAEYCRVCGLVETVLTPEVAEKTGHYSSYYGKTCAKNVKCDACDAMIPNYCTTGEDDCDCDYCNAEVDVTLEYCTDVEACAGCDLGKHYDDDKDHNCDHCGKVMSKCKDADKDEYCDYCDSFLGEVEDTEGEGTEGEGTEGEGTEGEGTEGEGTEGEGTEGEGTEGEGTEGE